MVKLELLILNPLKSLTKKHSNGNSLKSSIVKEQAYDKKSTSVIKYFLYEYEIFLLKTENSLFVMPDIIDFFTDFEKLYPIEHIAPQNKMPGDEKINNIHYFGNLVLTKHNRQLENKSFIQKKEIYCDSDLQSERELCLIEKWNDREINQRSKNLASFALSRWKV